MLLTRTGPFPLVSLNHHDHCIQLNIYTVNFDFEINKVLTIKDNKRLRFNFRFVKCLANCFNNKRW